MPKYDIAFDPPLMNAAGSLGFAPQAQSRVDYPDLGAFITNPVSLGPRTPAQGTRYLAFSGGFLLHTGYPNPGLKAVLRRYAARWKRSPVPVLVSLLVQAPGELQSALRRMEAVEGISGVELGLPSNCSGEAASALVRAAAGELPVIARLPLERAVELAQAAVEAGAAAVSLGPPRGSLPDPEGNLVEGRLYGPALFPLALQVVRQLSRIGLPVIGAGGVYRSRDAQVMLSVGAMAVQLDTVLWRGGPPWPA